MKIKGPEKLLFGTGGMPHSTHTSMKSPSTADGIAQIRKLGLGAMELEFVRQIYIKKETAGKIAEAAKKHQVVLTCHSPYFINLNAKEKPKIHASHGYIANSAIITALCGGWSTCFHAGYYMKDPPESVYKIIKENLKEIVKRVHGEVGKNIWVRPEVSGKVSQFGSLQEILKLSQEIEGVMPCIDFSHLHARTNGKFNTHAEFRSVLQEVEKSLGKEGLQNMHIHVSGIEYGEKGEKNHVNLRQSDMNYKDLCKAWREFKVRGVVVSESPDIEGDALLMKKEFEK
ncbi:MAG TPA: TIM barrel protein [Nanoarchaeota archaeon]|nr:TIM barrel protein [Nanoarchaeota archaeon]HIH34646.1 TIM barrel protein [Nanoarchaeota archaeon]HIH51293.1 TIM barrel protein [Nanoarchaeota archaeon]HIH65632.1 TIM barrel protein [Nanoarchaeota archaeon]